MVITLLNPKTENTMQEVKRYIFTKILNESGDYDPEFEIASDGWLFIKGLKNKH